MNNPSEPGDAELERALRASAALEEPPPDVLQRAIGLFPSTSPSASAAIPAWLTGLQRRVAMLVSDSGLVPTLAMGVRSAASGVRQLLYSAEGRDIDLRVAPDADGAQRWQIAGQVLGPDLSGRVVLCDAHGGVHAEADLDELCEFRLPPVSAGEWRIVLVTSDVAIELPPLKLPAA